MAMLAERRRKTKWMNPGRQALWKRDSGDATFGREMMEKMGWKVGQGLGANEQGIKEPLRIAFKNDNKGMGYKDNDNEWIQQQSEFDEFLSKLSSEKKELSKDSQTNTVQSLEERSRLSKARVHYHKFTRGKDLTKYSKKDLECITGRNKEEYEMSGKLGSCNENVGNEDKCLISAGSMVDYFAKKMQSKKKKDDDPLNIMDHEKGENSLENSSKNEPEEKVDGSTMEFDEKKKKKSKKKKEKDEVSCNEAPCDEMDIHKKNGTEEVELVGVQEEKEEIKNVDESTMESDEKKKKKSKKKKEKDGGGFNEAPCDEMDIDNNDCKMKSSSEGSKKSKKSKIVQEPDQSDPLDGSRGCENGIAAEVELVGVQVEKEEIENVDESTMEFDEKKKKKSKKKKEKDEVSCNEAPCDEMDIHKKNGTEEVELVGVQEEKEEIKNVDESTMESDEKKKKKSKKKKEKDGGGFNEAPCDEMDIDNNDCKMKSSSEGSKKSKKSKIVQEPDQSDPLDGSRGCENGIAAEVELFGVQEEKENVNDRNLEADEILGEKLKKKKKRKKEENLEEFDTENVEALNVLENKDGECDGTQEKADSLISAEGVRKKKKTSKRDRRAIIDEDDEGASKEKIKRKKKCLEAENRFNYEDCGSNENDLNPVSHTETNFKKEKENRKTKCESAVGNRQETGKDERERIAGEDPLYYKGELLKKENSFKGTSRNKLLNLIYSTNIEQFSGSNLGKLSGYGVVSRR